MAEPKRTDLSVRLERAALVGILRPGREKEDEESFDIQTINTAQLDGIPSCPHCEGPGACVCECGALFCITGRERDGAVVCPRCNEAGEMGTGGSFDLRQSEG